MMRSKSLSKLRYSFEIDGRTLGLLRAAALEHSGGCVLSATTCRWLLHLNCPYRRAPGGRYSASKFAASISQAGQERPVVELPETSRIMPLARLGACRV